MTDNFETHSQDDLESHLAQLANLPVAMQPADAACIPAARQGRFMQFARSARC